MKPGKGPALWQRAREIIPGGTQLLSKRAEIFLPGLWPAYFERAKGVEVWDLDGRRLIDMSIMGVGACVLGYADDEVNRAVTQAVEAGSMCTLNCPEEVALAELMLELHPWAGMVRLAKGGGDAMSIAVRIARAFTGREVVAFCGYHGWCDWYLAANLADDASLDGHLMQGLTPRGVPRGLAGTALPFNYNSIEELEAIFKAKERVAAVVMEPIRYQKPEPGFIDRVAELCRTNGAVLVFDEITTGWRLRVGGAYEDYGVDPDMVVYGKALANGFPQSVVVGRREVMDAAETSFISSTMWTERIGPAATLATVAKLRREDVPRQLVAVGQRVKAGWRDLADKHGLKLEVMGIDPLATFHLDHGDKSQALHTLFTQEMLSRGYMASGQLYVCYAHTDEVVSDYLAAVDEVFAVLGRAASGDPSERLVGPVAQSKFKRLN